MINILDFVFCIFYVPLYEKEKTTKKGTHTCPGLGRGTELAIFTDEPPPLEGGARRVDDALGFSIPGGGFNGSKLAAPIRPGGKDFDLSAIETEAVGAAGVGTIIALAGC